MTIQEIFDEMQQASRGFAAGATRARDVAESLYSLRAALAGLCAPAVIGCEYKRVLDEYGGETGRRSPQCATEPPTPTRE